MGNRAVAGRVGNRTSQEVITDINLGPFDITVHCCSGGLRMFEGDGDEMLQTIVVKIKKCHYVIVTTALLQ